MGKLENRSTTTKYSRLIARIETVRKDPRYAFMFDNANVGGDTMVEVLGQLFRLPANGKPMTVMQLAGFPSEVVDSVVSVLGRMAFEFGLWSDGAVQLLFVCEEAHRYAPGDKSHRLRADAQGHLPHRQGRPKYGVFLGAGDAEAGGARRHHHLPVQHAVCHAHGQRRDQAVIRSAVSDAAASLLAFVPSLGTREVFAFGEGVALPTRLRFGQLPPSSSPRANR